jgi:hypothetical protein
MDFDFFNHTSNPKGLRRGLYLMQRTLRMTLRPMLFRLRDLIAHLYHRQEADRAHINDLQNQVQQLKEEVARLMVIRRAFQLDHLALTRRVAMLEDMLLGNLQKNDFHDELLPLDANNTRDIHTRKVS